ncbi:Uncharacterised protein [Bordetella pertussis]|nr:Uncharacterised protein [Bordetella pertussis]
MHQPWPARWRAKARALSCPPGVALRAPTTAICSAHCSVCSISAAASSDSGARSWRATSCGTWRASVALPWA